MFKNIIRDRDRDRDREPPGSVKFTPLDSSTAIDLQFKWESLVVGGSTRGLRDVTAAVTEWSKGAARCHRGGHGHG
jgi:hypothetical protein